MITTWWFACTDEESDLCGEEFFVEVDCPFDEAKKTAIKTAKEIFKDEKLSCYGRVTQTEAEMMGLDTY